jgi:hypothetical protein
MSTDYRALCAELANHLQGRKDLECGWPGEDPEQDLLDRARAALAQPEPEGVGDVQIMELMPQQLQKDLATVSRLAAHGAGPDVGPGLFRVSLNTGIIEHCRAVLTRYARPTIEPVPVTERLPGPEDCCGNPRNGRGRWCWGRVLPQTDAGTPVVWRLMLAESLIDEATHWLPHNALPAPGAEVG